MAGRLGHVMEWVGYAAAALVFFVVWSGSVNDAGVHLIPMCAAIMYAVFVYLPFMAVRYVLSGSD